MRKGLFQSGRNNMRSVKQAVRLLLPVLAGALALLLSGCSVLGYFMTPDWVEDADLIVVNQNETPVYAITVSAGGGSETTADAGGYALLERGESYGLYLEDGAEPCQRVGQCRTIRMWNEFQELVNHYFDSITLADLMQEE